MPVVATNPIVLNSIELKGIGPYIEKNRMDVKPLTILCGENGSGKSTWFKVIDLLAKSVSNPRFPFTLSGSDWDNSLPEYEYINKSLHLPPRVADDEPQESFDAQLNSPCFISLVLETSTAYQTPDKPIGGDAWPSPSTEVQKALWHGTFSAGSTIELRLGVPSDKGQIAEGFKVGMHHFAEIRINAEHRIGVVWRAAGGVHLTPDGRPATVSNVEPPVFWCTEGMLPGDDDTDAIDSAGPEEAIETDCGNVGEVDGAEAIIPLGTVISKPFLADTVIENLAGNEVDLAGPLWKAFVSLFRHLAETALASVHRIGVYRRVHERDSAAAKDSLANGTEGRVHVGIDGENAWAIRNRRARDAMTVFVDGSPHVYTAEHFINYWLMELLNIRLDSENAVATEWSDVRGPVTGFRSPGVNLGYWGMPLDSPTTPYNKVWNRNFGTLVKKDEDVPFDFIGHGDRFMPSHLISTGFHQLFPIIVQAAFMRKYDVLAVENPEAHLHPSLQLKVAEFLIHMAKSGRRVVIETHCDLIVQRVLRGILSEELKQAEVQIYFAEVAKDLYVRQYLPIPPDMETDIYTGEAATFDHCKLTRIGVDNNGRVANWPPGFMDDAVRESQRLLDIMYFGISNTAEPLDDEVSGSDT